MSNISNLSDISKSFELRCSCNRPCWKIEGHTASCTNCKTEVDIGAWLTNMSESNSMDIVDIKSIYDELEMIIQHLKTMRNLSEVAMKYKNENKVLLERLSENEIKTHRIESRCDDLIKQNTLMKKEQQANIDIRQLMISILDYTSEINNAILDYGDDPNIIRNRIETQSIKLTHNIEKTGAVILKHDRGYELEQSLCSDIADVSYCDTCDKSLDGIVKTDIRYGCKFPDDSDVKNIPEKIEVWSYNKAIDPSCKTCVIRFISNNLEKKMIEVDKKEHDTVYLSDFSEIFCPDPGYHFIGWSEDIDGHALIGDTIDVEGDISIYAIWSDKHDLTIHFISPDGYDQVPDKIFIVKKGQIIDVSFEGKNGLVPEVKEYISKNDDSEVCYIKLLEQRCDVHANVEDPFYILYDGAIYHQNFLMKKNSNIQIKCKMNDLPLIQIGNIKSDTIAVCVEDYFEKLTIDIIVPKDEFPDGYFNNTENMKPFSVLDFGNFNISLSLDENHIYEINDRKIRFKISSCDVQSYSEGSNVLKLCFIKYARIFWSTNSQHDKTEMCLIGSSLHYDLPLRKPCKGYSYIFDRWEPEPHSALGDTSFRAHFKKITYEEAVLDAIRHGKYTRNSINKYVKVEKVEDVINKLIGDNKICEERRIEGKKTVVEYRIC